MPDAEQLFKIEKNVEVPPPRRGKPRKYFWDKMIPGDSAAFDVKSGQFEAAKVSAQKYFKAKGWEMTTRLLGAFGRIWRVS